MPTRVARRAALSRRELALATACFGGFALLLFAPHVVRGGWVYDDWALIAALHFAHGFGGTLDAAMDIIYRPGYGLTLFVEHAIAGEGQSPYLAIGAALMAIQATLFYVVLRQIGFSAIGAAGPVVLFVAVPSIDGARLWIASFNALWCTAFLLGGTASALAGVAAGGRRALIWHAAAFVLYVAAGVTYELAIPLILLSPVLYGLAAGAVRPALVRAPADIAAAAVAAALTLPGANKERGGTFAISYLLDRLHQLWSAWVDVLKLHVPLSDVVLGPVGIAALVAGAAGLVLRSRDEGLSRIRFWAAAAVLGFVWAWAGLAALLPATDYYIPRWQGIASRFAALAWLGEAVMVAALLWLLALGLTALVRRPGWAMPVAGVLVAAVTVTWSAQEIRNQGAWADSWVWSQRAMSRTLAALPHPPHGSYLVAFRVPVTVDVNGPAFALDPQQGGGVPVFDATWDFDGAVRYRYKDNSLHAVPFFAGWTCGPKGWSAPAAFQGALPGLWGPYSNLYFVNVEARQPARVPDQATCERLVSEMTAPPMPQNF